jgi:hypothetical protein
LIVIIGPKNSLQVRTLLDKASFDSLPSFRAYRQPVSVHDKILERYARRTSDRLLNHVCLFTDTLETGADITIQMAIKAEVGFALIDCGFRRKPRWPWRISW